MGKHGKIWISVGKHGQAWEKTELWQIFGHHKYVVTITWLNMGKCGKMLVSVENYV